MHNTILRNQILEESLLDSTTTTPIYFILSPGANVVGDLDKLGDKYDFVKNESYHNVSMGQGQVTSGETPTFKDIRSFSAYALCILCTLLFEPFFLSNQAKTCAVSFEQATRMPLRSDFPIMATRRHGCRENSVVLRPTWRASRNLQNDRQRTQRCGRQNAVLYSVSHTTFMGFFCVRFPAINETRPHIPSKLSKSSRCCLYPFFVRTSWLCPALSSHTETGTG